MHLVLRRLGERPDDQPVDVDVVRARRAPRDAVRDVLGHERVGNTRVHRRGPLFVTGWALLFIALVLEVTYDGAIENPAPHTVSSAGSAHVMVPAATAPGQTVHA